LDASNGFLDIFFLVTWFFFCLKVSGFLRISDKVVPDGFGWNSCIPGSSAKSLSGKESDFIQESLTKSGEIDCEVYYHSEHIRNVLYKL
jgi:hypothetical protein